MPNWGDNKASCRASARQCAPLARACARVCAIGAHSFAQFRTVSHSFAQFRTVSHSFARFRTVSHGFAQSQTQGERGTALETGRPRELHTEILRKFSEIKFFNPKLFWWDGTQNSIEKLGFLVLGILSLVF